MSRRFDAVIFDYGGVLSTPPFAGLGRFERERGYEKGAVSRLLFGGERDQRRGDGDDERSVAEIAATTYDALGGDDNADWHLLETGRISLADYRDRLVERAPDGVGAEGVLEVFDHFLRAVLFGINWPVVHRVRELRAAGYKTAICTNNIAEWSEMWQATIPVEIFDEIVDSSTVGLRKPLPAMYRLVCERLGVAPERAVFLDDSAGHVAGARAAGLTGIVVADPARALADLDEVLSGSPPPGAAKPQT